ncbi:UNVERIFIED_CONTAM: hypothetical protein FKN15_014746 [Acipenser sinensis]
MTERQPISSQLSPVNKTLSDIVEIHREYKPPTGSRMHLAVSPNLSPLTVLYTPLLEIGGEVSRNKLRPIICCNCM